MAVWWVWLIGVHFNVRDFIFNVMSRYFLRGNNFFAACNILMYCMQWLIDCAYYFVFFYFSNGKAEILTKLQTSCHPISVFFRYVIIIVK